MLTELAGRRVTIVGGAGFIGHHLALSLVRQGAEVSVVDSLMVNNAFALVTGARGPKHDLYLRILQERIRLLSDAGVGLLVQDARDYHATGRLLSELQPDVIVHAAAVAHAGRSNKDPFSTFDHSLRTLENTLDWARERRTQFVFLSSSMVYGNFLTASVDETHPLEPIGIYGALKVAGEKMVIAYGQVFDLPWTIVRPSALYGPRCISQRVGQLFIENAFEGLTLRIQGDGSERLDFTYVDDLVQGIELAIARPESRHEIFNLTYGAARSVGEVARIVQQHLPGTEVEHVERDHLMPERGTLSVDKARALLGYAPQNPVEVGFEKYIDWYRDVLGQAPGASAFRAAAR